MYIIKIKITHYFKSLNAILFLILLNLYIILKLYAIKPFFKLIYINKHTQIIKYILNI